MKRFSEQFNTKAQTIKLSVAEKRDLRERVVSYMEYHPLPNSTRTAGQSVDLTSPVFFISRAKFWQTAKLSTAFVLMLIVGVSYAAEQAVPGDALYAIKVGVNEEFRSTMARSPYEKVVWETERLNRRISEARLLANEGRLTEEVEVQVAQAVKEHSENARKEIANLKITDKDGAALASIELNTALDVQTTSLRSRTDVEAAGHSTSLIENVLEFSQAAEASVEADTLPAYAPLIAKVESETTRAHELLKGVKESATKDEQKDISRRLEDIERKVEAAMNLSETEEIEARLGLVEVLRQTHRLIVFMTNIDVRASLAVNDIVPVTLTEEERVTIAKTQITEAKAMLLQIDEAIVSTTTEPISADVLEKLNPAITESTTTIAEAEALLAVEPLDVAQFEALAKDAFDVTLDVMKVLNLRKDESIEIPIEEVIEEVEVLEEDTEAATSTGTSTEDADVAEEVVPAV
ncbi:MAG: hypothetical protein UW75_C0039G0007 [Parcubacteria group bacterium GW2011_GWF2_44_8]|nr:MAG: hypothetical protein UW75_C0039G0007 [Parcubacteria group bacterium GW2011_GWF2_44_8]